MKVFWASLGDDPTYLFLSDYYAECYYMHISGETRGDGSSQYACARFSEPFCWAVDSCRTLAKGRNAQVDRCKRKKGQRIKLCLPIDSYKG